MREAEETNINGQNGNLEAPSVQEEGEQSDNTHPVCVEESAERVQAEEQNQEEHFTEPFKL